MRKDVIMREMGPEEGPTLCSPWRCCALAKTLRELRRVERTFLDWISDPALIAAAGRLAPMRGALLMGRDPIEIGGEMQ
jgi:hypothetical protein